jgi:hypothetical protein
LSKGTISSFTFSNAAGTGAKHDGHTLRPNAIDHPLYLIGDLREGNRHRPIIATVEIAQHSRQRGQFAGNRPYIHSPSGD